MAANEDWKKVHVILSALESFPKCQMSPDDFLRPTVRKTSKFYEYLVGICGIKFGPIMTSMKPIYDCERNFEEMMYFYVLYICVRHIYRSMDIESLPLLKLPGDICFMDFMEPSNDPHFINRTYVLTSYLQCVKISRDYSLAVITDVVETFEKPKSDEELKSLNAEIKTLSKKREEVQKDVDELKRESDENERKIRELTIELRKQKIQRDNLAKRVEKYQPAKPEQEQEAYKETDEEIEDNLEKNLEQLNLLINLPNISYIIDQFVKLKKLKYQEEDLLKENKSLQNRRKEKFLQFQEEINFYKKFDQELKILTEASKARNLPVEQELDFLVKELKELRKDFNAPSEDLRKQMTIIHYIENYCNTYVTLIADQRIDFRNMIQRFATARDSIDKKFEDVIEEIKNAIKAQTFEN